MAAKKRWSLSIMVLLDLETVVMFAPWLSQKSLREHKDPITGNSFIGLHNSNKDLRRYYCKGIF